MSKRTDGGPAFPEHLESEKGMTLRDWFAGQAISAIIIATSAGQHQPRMREGEPDVILAMARDAYSMADAMLKERKK